MSIEPGCSTGSGPRNLFTKSLNPLFYLLYVILHHGFMGADFRDCGKQHFQKQAAINAELASLRAQQQVKKTRANEIRIGSLQTELRTLKESSPKLTVLAMFTGRTIMTSGTGGKKFQVWDSGL